LTLVPPPDQDAVTRLFDEARAPEEIVRADDWHPTGGGFAELDLCDTIAARRRWYLALAESGRL
jgi:hypothetical protein